MKKKKSDSKKNSPGRKKKIVSPIPKGFHTITPYFIVVGSANFVDFASKAFGAKVSFRMDAPDGTVAHASMKIGDSMIELSEAKTEFPAVAMAIHVYVKDVDTAFNNAVAAGAVSIMEPKTQFYGDRESFVKDPFGNSWFISTHVEDVTPKEMQKRMAAQGK